MSIELKAEKGLEFTCCCAGPRFIIDAELALACIWSTRDNGEMVLGWVTKLKPDNSTGELDEDVGAFDEAVVDLHETDDLLRSSGSNDALESSSDTLENRGLCSLCNGGIGVNRACDAADSALCGTVVRGALDVGGDELEHNSMD